MLFSQQTEQAFDEVKMILFITEFYSKIIKKRILLH